MPYEKLEIPAGRTGWVRTYSPVAGVGEVHLHAHRELEVNLILRGTGSYLIEGGRYPIEPGSLLWLFPGQPHVLVEASADFQMRVGVFRPRLVQALTAEAGPDIQILRQRDPGAVFVRKLRPATARDLEGIFVRLEEALPEDNAFFNSGLGYLLRVAWEASLAARPMASVSRIHPAVEKAIHLLRAEDQNNSLVDLAAQAGISYSRLCSLFTSQIGETLNQFRNRMRIQRFQELAATHPHRTLLDLALEAGFGSYAQCHRMVVRLTGQPPARMR